MSIFTSLVDYFKSSKAELEKVTWPSRQETLRYSTLVLGISVIVAAFFASLDFGLNRVVEVALEKKLAAPAQTKETQPTPTTTSTPAAPSPLNFGGIKVETEGGEVKVNEIP